MTTEATEALNEGIERVERLLDDQDDPKSRAAAMLLLRIAQDHERRLQALERE